MSRRVLVLSVNIVALLIAAILPSLTLCEEGMWLPQELPEAVLREINEEGCGFSREQIFNTAGTGIANAIVKVGATGAFVSPEGLILTNHHVAFGAVQRMSTANDNYIARGFLARTRKEEVPAQGYLAYVIQSVEDVTSRVLSAVKPSMASLERHAAIERRTKEIVKAEEARKDVYCEVRSFSGGARYLLYRFLRIRDVRVVYVPSRSIGEYGGEIDNWMWPRHTGDFSFLRAYVSPRGKPADFSEANVPYRPKSWLKVSPEGLKEGDLTIIVGFPGGSHRYLTSYALANYEEFTFPERIRLYTKMARILEEQSAQDAGAAVRVASILKGVYNDLKHNQGILDGFKKSGIVERQRKKEAEVASMLEADTKKAEHYIELLDKFRLLSEKQADYRMKDLLLGFLFEERLMLSQAMLLYKWGVDKQMKDLDRDPDFMDRRIPDLKRDLTIFQTQLDPGSDRELLKMFLLEIAALPESQRVKALEDIFGSKHGEELEEQVDMFLDGMYASTRLGSREERLRMFDLPLKHLKAEGDAFIALAARLFDENEQRLERKKELSGVNTTLMPKWVEILGKASTAKLYPDANGTMRFNYGHVEGYSPRDAVRYVPFTGLKGVVEKNTGVEPFDCPEKILKLAAAQEHGAYFDSELGDVPVNFLTTNDSTRGNSGSAVLNAKGELVGSLFDGNYEGVSHDFMFQEDLTRSISVDIRYVLWVADFVDDAQNVLDELGVK